ncbi:MAG: hypothetical protein KDD60_08150 [Bdellovibrionales bacterium]|nr:hypothetical protein [Bdellovibrionales bacterium]
MFPHVSLSVSTAGELLFTLNSFAFTVFGATILYFERSYIVQRSSKELISTTSLPFLRFMGNRVAFDEIIGVSLSRQLTSEEDGIGLCFPLSLEVKDLKKPLPIETFLLHTNARRAGEILAKALDKPFHDNSSGRMLIKLPEHTSFSLLRSLKNSPPPEEPLHPETMHSRIHIQKNKLHISIPPFPLLDSLHTVWAPPILLFIFLCWLIDAIVGSLPADLTSYGLAVSVVFLCSVSAFLFRKENVEVNSEAITLHSHFLVYSSSTTIPIEAIEGIYTRGKERDDTSLEFLKALVRGSTYSKVTDIFLPYRCLSSSILIRSQNRDIAFGRTVDFDELPYLVYQIETWIRSHGSRSQ